MSFISVLAVEMMADVYAKALRRDRSVYSILRKCSELHEIEEGRHMYYARLWLKHIIDHAGWIMRSIYSINVCLTIWYMRSMYVQRVFFERLGVDDTEKYFRAAKKQLKLKYLSMCLAESIEFFAFHWRCKLVYSVDMEVDSWSKIMNIWE